MEHAVLSDKVLDHKMSTLGVILGSLLPPPKADQNDVRNVMRNEAPKKPDLCLGGTLARVVKHTCSTNMSMLRGRGKQMAQASV